MLCSGYYHLDFKYSEDSALTAKHYKTYSELTYAAGRGRELCSTFEAAFLQCYCDEKDCFIDEAKEFNFEEDKDNVFKDEASRSRFIFFVSKLEIDARFFAF